MRTGWRRDRRRVKGARLRAQKYTLSPTVSKGARPSAEEGTGFSTNVLGHLDMHMTGNEAELVPHTTSKNELRMRNKPRREESALENSRENRRTYTFVTSDEAVVS